MKRLLSFIDTNAMLFESSSNKARIYRDTNEHFVDKQVGA